MSAAFRGFRTRRVVAMVCAVVLLMSFTVSGAAGSTRTVGVAGQERVAPQPLDRMRAYAQLQSGVGAALAPTDDDFPGVIDPSPVIGSLSPGNSDLWDIVQVTIDPGEIFTAEIRMDLGEWVTAWLFPSDATIEDGVPLALAYYYDETHDRLSYYSASGGTFSLVILAPEPELWGDGVLSYNVGYEGNAQGDDWEVASANALAASQSDSLDWRFDVNDVYYVDLVEGDELSVALTGDHPDTRDIELSFYGPDATSVWGASPVAQYDWGSGTDEIRFLVPPGGAGRYYVEAWTLIYDEGYTLTSSIAEPIVPRVFGANRYSTSSATSKANWVTSSAAVLATGSDPADALAASALAGALDAPVLLVPPYSKYSSVYDVYLELDRLGCSDVYIVGGDAAVDAAIETELTQDGYSVHRISGVNRYVTAAQVADEVRSITPTGTAFVVRGDDFADALAVAPYAFSQGIPVLLTKPGTLHSSTAAFIESNDITDVIVAGGVAAVTEEVADQIRALNGGTTVVTRKAGVNRYSTARDIAVYCIDTRTWASWDFVGVATGQSFPDALAGGAACGKRGGALLLTKTGSLSIQAEGPIADHAPGTVMLFGGPAAVSDAVKGAIQALYP